MRTFNVNLEPIARVKGEPFVCVEVYPAYVKGKGFGFYLTAKFRSGTNYFAHVITQPERGFVLIHPANRDSSKKLDGLADSIALAIAGKDPEHRIWQEIGYFCNKHGLKIAA